MLTADFNMFKFYLDNAGVIVNPKGEMKGQYVISHHVQQIKFPLSLSIIRDDIVMSLKMS